MPAMKHDDIITARRAVAALSPSKHLRRYPIELRARLAAVVRAHPELSVCSLARRIDMAQQTLERIVTTAPTAFVPVRVVGDQERASLRVHGPRGIVVEGLDIAGVADLVRALS
jgi:DNA-binding transcriptional ArsR family regulator